MTASEREILERRKPDMMISIYISQSMIQRAVHSRLEYLFRLGDETPLGTKEYEDIVDEVIEWRTLIKNYKLPISLQYRLRLYRYKHT